MKILLQTEEDKMNVALNNGLMSLSDVSTLIEQRRAEHLVSFVLTFILQPFQAFTTLHLMYHEATACHVTGDLTDVLSVMLNILNCCHANMNRQGR